MKTYPQVLITTVPFGAKNRLPLDLLEQAGISYLINPLGKKLTADELAGLIPGVEVLIAGTEEINQKVFDQANNLKFISRVGIGLDSVDLQGAKAKNIKVSYTPDAPAPAVAELTLGLMLSLLRMTHIANSSMHAGQWNRYFGRRLAEMTVGVIGLGRIGTRVLKHLEGFSPRQILVHDIDTSIEPDTSLPLVWSTKEEIFKNADVITLHVPLTAATKNMISRKELALMKPDAVLVNTARGGIVNEADLCAVLQEGHLAGAAMDVFEIEPYQGCLSGIERCLLTSHMGSMSEDCRTQMEIEATQEAIRFLQGQPLLGEVPEHEYKLAR